MPWSVVLCFAAVLVTSNAFPIDTALSYDLDSGFMGSGYYGPFSPYYMTTGRYFSPSPILPYSYPRSGVELIGSSNPVMSSVVYADDYSKTTEFAKENYIRDSYRGGTEYGVRDSMAVHNGPAYMSALPYPLQRGLGRTFAMTDYDMWPRRGGSLLTASAWPRIGGDYQILRR